MKHAYDDYQIAEAGRAGLNATGNPVHVDRDFLRAFLDALPEPAQDDWQQCAWDDILHTDERVKAEYTSGTIIEGVPDGINDTRIWLVDGNTMPFESDAKWYRIPAPVTPPDPAQHQFIRVDGKDYEAIPESGRYKLLGPGLATVHVINRENITEWTELELVPKEVADGDR